MKLRSVWGDWFAFKGTISRGDFIFGLMGVVLLYVLSEVLHHALFHYWLRSACPASDCLFGIVRDPFAFYRDVFQIVLLFGKFLPLLFRAFGTMTRKQEGGSA